MAQTTAPSPPLEGLLLAALAGGALAPGLQQRVKGLISWLITEELRLDGERDRAARALADRLLDLYDQARDQARKQKPSRDAADEKAAETGADGDHEVPQGDDAREGAADGDHVSEDKVSTDETRQDADDQTDLSASQTPVVVEQPPAESVAAQELRRLWDELDAEPAHRRYLLPHGEPCATGDLETARRLWNALQLVCLKLPREVADRVTTAATSAVSALPEGAFPPPWDEGVPQLADVIEVIRPGTGSRPWAEQLPTVERFAWLAAHDPGVQLGFSSIATSNSLCELTAQRITQFHWHAGERLKRMADEKPDSPGEFDGLVELDELLRGLVPVPLPALDSRWMTQLDRWTSLLTAHKQARDIQMLSLGIVNLEAARSQYESISPRMTWEKTAENRPVQPGRPVWILRYARRRQGARSKYGGRMLIESE